MQRKIVKQGAATMTMSLPASWVKAHHLRHGDSVHVEETKNLLIVAPEEQNVKKQTTLTFQHTSAAYIRNALVAVYRDGYDTITVRFTHEDDYQMILETIKEQFIGFDMVRKGNSVCVLENVTEPTIDHFETIFKKVFYNSSLMISQTEERLKGKTSFSEYPDVMIRIHQYDNFCRRILTKKNVLGEKTTPFWEFLSNVVHAQRELYHLNRFLDKNTIHFKHFTLYGKLKNYLERLERTYFKKEITPLEELHRMQEHLIDEDKFYELLEKYLKESSVVYHTVASLRHLYLASIPLMALVSK